MNRFTKQTDPKKTCDGCGKDPVRRGAYGLHCAECETYLTAAEMIRVNLGVTIERWRHRHGLSREGALEAARDFIGLDDEWIHAAMDGYSYTELQEEEEDPA